MDFLNVTKALIIIVFCAIFIWDMAVMFFAKDLSATISFAIHTLSCEHPIIAFAIGVLCGHVFWPLGGSGSQ